MTLQWKTCPICDGYGELIIMKSRTVIIKDNEQQPLLKDELQKCYNCKGTGQVYTKIMPLNPWQLPNKEDKNE